MVQIMRVTSRWEGFTGSPGFTVMHFRDFDTEGAITPAQASAALERVRAFWDGIKASIPSAVRIQPLGEVEILEDSDGSLQDVVTAGSVPVAIAGTSAGVVAGPAGAVVNWRTSAIRNGRRIRGRSFIVPLGATAYEANGSLAPAAHTAFNAAAQALAASTGTPDLGVYSRPSGPGATDGQWAVVTGYSVPDKVAVLRSRRD